MEGVNVAKIAKKMKLHHFTEDIDLKDHRIILSDVNRPALQLNGFFEHFEQSRVEIIGMVEYANLQKKTEEEKKAIFTDIWQGENADEGCVIERPKMLYNEKTKKYVIWFHADGQDPFAGDLSRTLCFWKQPTATEFRYLAQNGQHQDLWRS